MVQALIVLWFDHEPKHLGVQNVHGQIYSGGKGTIQTCSTCTYMYHNKVHRSANNVFSASLVHIDKLSPPYGLYMH